MFHVEHVGSRVKGCKTLNRRSELVVLGFKHEVRSGRRPKWLGILEVDEASYDVRITLCITAVHPQLPPTPSGISSIRTRSRMDPDRKMLQCLCSLAVITLPLTTLEGQG